MARFDILIATAKRLLARNGETSTLSRATPGTPADPAKPWEPGAPGVTNTKVSAVWLNESVIRRATLAKEGEVFAILAGKDLKSDPDPATDVLIRADKSRWALIEVRPLNPNGQNLIFEVTARQ